MKGNKVGLVTLEIPLQSGQSWSPPWREIQYGRRLPECRVRTRQGVVVRHMGLKPQSLLEEETEFQRWREGNLGRFQGSMTLDRIWKECVVVNPFLYREGRQLSRGFRYVET